MAAGFIAAMMLIGATAVAAPGVPQPVTPGTRNPSYGGSPALDVCAYTQASDGSGFGQASQNFEAAFDAYDCNTYEDFTLGSLVNVSGFHADGVYYNGTGPATAVTFSLYADAGGAPACGVPFYSTTVPAGGYTDSLGTFNYETGATLVSLAPGTYWLSVQATMDFGVGGQWAWASSSNPHTLGSSCFFDNPGGGFGAAPCAVLTDYDPAFCLLMAGEPPPECPGSLLEQTSDGSLVGQASQDFETANDAFDCFSIDDFSVPSGVQWSISGFHADGVYFNGAGPADSVNFLIYPDAGGVPACGSPIFSVNVPAAGIDDGTGTFSYDSGGTLTTLCEGTYWLSVQVVMDFSVGGQWAWVSSTTPHTRGGSVVFDNPGAGFGTPPCAPLTDYDAAYCIFGVVGPCDEVVCRAGNVGTEFGASAENVLTVNGSSGDPAFRVVNVPGGGLITIGVVASSFGPPNAHWALWVYDGAPSAGTVTPLQYKTTPLGLGCMCLPVNRSAGLPCDCPVTIPLGRTSKTLRPAKAAAFCVAQPPEARTPVSFSNISLPAGMTFTVGGVMFDNGSPNAKPISIMNWVIVNT